MPKLVTKDTYAFEDVSGVEVRRQVFAGGVIPDHYRLEDEGAAEELEGNDFRGVTYGEPVTGPDDEGKRSSTVPTGRSKAQRESLAKAQAARAKADK